MTDRIVIPLHEETVSVERRTTENRISVRVSTSAQEQVIDETLHKEAVEVERIPVNREVKEFPAVKTVDDVTIIPVVKEILVVERRFLITEEIHLRRVRTAERHLETVTLRTQQATIEQQDTETKR